MISKILSKSSEFGVVPRSMVKNELVALNRLIRQGLVRKVWKKGYVFYELTSASLPVLDILRCQKLQEAQLRALLYPQRQAFYRALLQDIRFLDITNSEANYFRFLGDWRLHSTPTHSQLALSQLRFYQQRGLA